MLIFIIITFIVLLVTNIKLLFFYKKKKKSISRISIEEMTVDIMYHVKVKNETESLLCWNIARMLRERGIDTEHIPLPRPRK